MAVNDDFREQWLEMNDEYGASVDGGIDEVTDVSDSVFLPGIEKGADGKTFKRYILAPMTVFWQYVKTTADAISTAWSQWFGATDADGVRGEWASLKQDATEATDAANKAAGDVTAAVDAAGKAADKATKAAQDADTSRQQIEANEQTRQGNETARVKAEAARVTAEQGRVTAEDKRVSAEEGRVSAEGARVTAENKRASAETARSKAEEGRASAETARAKAEEQRATDSEAIIKAVKAQGDAAEEQGAYAKGQGDRAKTLNDHPWELREDGYIWTYDETQGAMVRTGKMIIGFDELTEEQKQNLVSHFSVDYATVATCESIIDELS